MAVRRGNIARCWHACSTCCHCEWRGIRNQHPCAKCGNQMTPVRRLMADLMMHKIAKEKAAVGASE